MIAKPDLRTGPVNMILIPLIFNAYASKPLYRRWKASLGEIGEQLRTKNDRYHVHLLWLFTNKGIHRLLYVVNNIWQNEIKASGH